MELFTSIKNFIEEQIPQKYMKDREAFDRMSLGRNLDSYLPLKEQAYIYHEIINNPYWAKDAILKKKEIDRIVKPYELTRWFSGTNRMVYKVNYDSRAVIKIPFKHSGLPDGGKESLIQHFLKPFIPKVYDVGYNGVASLNERIYPIRTKEEFVQMREMHFELMRFFKEMGFFVNDAGVRAFMNFGIRENFGLVFVDFPEVYKAREGLRCRVCGGKIDYSPCFDKIQCRNCFREYNAQEVAFGTIQNYFNLIATKQPQQTKIEGGTPTMRVQILVKDQVTGQTRCAVDTGTLATSKTVEDRPAKQAANFKTKARAHMYRLPEEVGLQKEPVAFGTKNKPAPKKFNTPIEKQNGEVLTNAEPKNKKKAAAPKKAAPKKEKPVVEEAEETEAPILRGETSPLIAPTEQNSESEEEEVDEIAIEAARNFLDAAAKARKDTKKKRNIERKKKSEDEEFNEEDF